MERMTVPRLRAMKLERRKIVSLTAYDATMAAILDESGVDLILVGDSASMVVAGHPSTLPITMEQMLYHTQSVSRGVKKALVVADMPFLSYQCSPEQAILNAGRFLKEGGAEAVKLEGGQAMAETIRRLVEIGIPVMGHLGLTPQSIQSFGGYRLRGNEGTEARELKKDAKILEEAGVFSIVLEKVPADLAAAITKAVSVPTIGIGAGPHCDGQVLVTYDLLGLFEAFKPKFVRRYAELAQTIRQAVTAYADDVRKGGFPSKEESY